VALRIGLYCSRPQFAGHRLRHLSTVRLQQFAQSTAAHAQEKLLDKYPDLRAAPEAHRAEYLADKIDNDLLAFAFQGFWQGLLAALTFLPVSICQTVAAGHLLRRGDRLWRAFIPYMEVALVAFSWHVWLGMFPNNTHLLKRDRWCFALLSLLSTAWLAIGLLGVLRGWNWWRRWLMHLVFAAAVVVVWVVVNQLIAIDPSELGWHQHNV
jgi:hypothetical protein